MGGFNKGFTLKEIGNLSYKEFNKLLDYINTFHDKDDNKKDDFHKGPTHKVTGGIDQVMRQMQEEYRGEQSSNISN